MAILQMWVPRCVTLLFLWLLTAGICQAALVDIQRFKGLIALAHNIYRSYEKAANMKALKWDPYLQRRAAAWSETCYWGHHKGQGLGVNLAAFRITEPDTAVASVIVKSCQNWWREARRWSWSSSCGRACQYTQMIWANTERIGCSLSKCQQWGSENRESMQSAYYFVCIYDPPGNIEDQYPYIRGKQCSQCNPGDICVSGLCSTPLRKRTGQSRPVSKRRHSYRTVSQTARSRYLPARLRLLSLLSRYIRSRARSVRTRPRSRYVPSPSKYLRGRSRSRYLPTFFKYLRGRSRYVPAISRYLRRRSKYAPTRSRSTVAKSGSYGNTVEPGEGQAEAAVEANEL